MAASSFAQGMAPGIAQGFHQRTQNQLAEQQHKRQMRAAEAARTATAELARDRMLAAKQRNDATIAGAEARNIRSTDSADFRNKRTVAGSLWRTQKQQEGADTRASEARGHSLRTQATGLISKQAPGVAVEFQMAGIDPTTMTKQEQRDMLKAIRAERLRLDTDRDRRNLALARDRQAIRSEARKVDEEGKQRRKMELGDYNGRLQRLSSFVSGATMPGSLIKGIAGFSNEKYKALLDMGGGAMGGTAMTLLRISGIHGFSMEDTAADPEWARPWTAWRDAVVKAGFKRGDAARLALLE